MYDTNKLCLPTFHQLVRSTWLHVHTLTLLINCSHHYMHQYRYAAIEAALEARDRLQTVRDAASVAPEEDDDDEDTGYRARLFIPLFIESECRAQWVNLVRTVSRRDATLTLHLQR